jgi:hypothetical protein
MEELYKFKREHGNNLKLNNMEDKRLQNQNQLITTIDSSEDGIKTPDLG